MKARIAIGISVLTVVASAPAKADDSPSEAESRETAATWIRALRGKDLATVKSLATTPFDWGLDASPRSTMGKTCGPGVRVTTRKRLSRVIACLAADARIIDALGRPDPARLIVLSPGEVLGAASSDKAMSRFASDRFVAYSIMPAGSIGGVTFVVAVHETKAGPRIDGVVWWENGDQAL
jgi:hypothetical protein